MTRREDMGLSPTAPRVLEAFAGIGGLALAWHRVGTQHVGFIEREAFCQPVLRRHFAGVPVWDDVTKPGKVAMALHPGSVDVLSGGPPCQPVSGAGKQRGQADERWLWGSFIALATIVDAPVVFAENPPALLSVSKGAAFAEVLRRFTAAGYVVEWDCIGAGHAGAPHRRDRVWIVAWKARRNGCWTAWGQGVGRSGRWAYGDGEPEGKAESKRKWPWAGRYERGVLTRFARRWPSLGGKPIPWEVATDQAELDEFVAALRAGTTLRAGLPTPQGRDGKGAPGAGAQERGGFSSSLPAAVRRALPTPRVAQASWYAEDEATLAARGRGGWDTLAVVAVRRALPTPDVGAWGDGTDPDERDARLAVLPAAVERRNGNGAGRLLAVEARRVALPTPTSAAGENEVDWQYGNHAADKADRSINLTLKGAAKQAAGIPLQAGARRSALPTPTSQDSVDRDWQDADGTHYPTLAGAAKGAAGVDPQPGLSAESVTKFRSALPTPRAEDSESAGARHSRGVVDTLTAVTAVRAALPTPCHADGEDTKFNGPGYPSLGTAAGAHDVPATASPLRLNPTLPEWMQGFPDGWSHPEGVGLLEVPPEPWLPDRTSAVGLTAEKLHRRPRLKGLGNSVCVPAAQIAVELVVAAWTMLKANERRKA